MPCSLVVEGNPPDRLVTETVFKDIEHDGYRDWLHANGKPLPADPP